MDTCGIKPRLSLEVVHDLVVKGKAAARASVRAPAPASATVSAPARSPARRSATSSPRSTPKDKVTGQYTGWFLKGLKGDPTTTVNAPVWNAPQYNACEPTSAYGFGDYVFGNAEFGDAEYNFGDYTFASIDSVTWGEWDALPGENPDDCLRSQNADHITQISNIVTPGAITDGNIADRAITDGAITDGDTAPGNVTYVLPVRTGPVTNVGAAKVFATYTPTTGPAISKGL